MTMGAEGAQVKFTCQLANPRAPDYPILFEPSSPERAESLQRLTTANCPFTVRSSFKEGKHVNRIKCDNCVRFGPAKGLSDPRVRSG
jgi:hypothetical protein